VFDSGESASEAPRHHFMAEKDFEARNHSAGGRMIYNQEIRDKT